MENREQPSKQLPIDCEADIDISDAVEQEAPEAPAERALSEAQQSAEEAPTGDVPIESSDSSDPSDPSERISDAEIAQMLIDLSDAQERSAKLEEQKKQIYEQLLRRQAEFENFRKRVDRERADISARARADIVTELLPVLDNLERALDSSLPAEGSAGVQDGILTGVKLIHRQFLDVLSGLGLSPVKAVGEPFDPHKHEAVVTEANAELPENTVIAELQRGYMLGDKLLRPAMVKVAVRE